MSENTQLRLSVADDALFTRSDSGAIWGPISFELGKESFFPDRGWTDLVAGFSTAWLDALTRIAVGKASEERVWFMDGPFAIDISVRDQGLLRLALFHKDIQKHQLEGDVRGLLANAIEAGRQVIVACKNRAWTNKDVSDLAEAIERGVAALQS
jgi:hypothetical protein